MRLSSDTHRVIIRVILRHSSETLLSNTLIIFADTCQKHHYRTLLKTCLYHLSETHSCCHLSIFADTRQKLVHDVVNSSSKTHSCRHSCFYTQFLQTLFVTVIMNFQTFLHIVSKNALMSFYASRENGHDCPKIE